jgi:hypothetical protein
MPAAASQIASGRPGANLHLQLNVHSFFMGVLCHLTTAQEFLSNQEILDRTTDDVFLCDIALSKHEDACGRVGSYRWLISETGSKFVGT